MQRTDGTTRHRPDDDRLVLRPLRRAGAKAATREDEQLAVRGETRIAVERVLRPRHTAHEPAGGREEIRREMNRRSLRDAAAARSGEGDLPTVARERERLADTAGRSHEPHASHRLPARAGVAPEGVVRVLVEESASRSPAHLLECLAPRCDRDRLWRSRAVRVDDDHTVEAEAPGIVRVPRRPDVRELCPVGRPHGAVAACERVRGHRGGPSRRLFARQAEQGHAERRCDRRAGRMRLLRPADPEYAFNSLANVILRC